MQQSINMLRHLSKTNNLILLCTYTNGETTLHVCKYSLGKCKKTDLNKIQKEQNKTIRLAYNLPMWTSVDELHQIRNLETASNTTQKLSSEYLAGAKKRNKEYKNITEKQSINWSQIKMYQTTLQNIL